MRELIVTLAYDEETMDETMKPITIWDEDCFEQLYMSSTSHCQGAWGMPISYGSLSRKHRKEYTIEQFEEEFGFGIEVLLQPGNKCVIRADITNWGVVEYDD
jgi:hypothetical protein